MKDLTSKGFKAGIEIHQRLDTSKLFCNCDSSISEEEPINTISRFLRPVAGETGELDRAALFESLRSRKFEYLCYPETTCLVEADEEPPHEVKQDALETSVLIAKMFNCSVPDEIEFMRKTVIDGSNTSGFQRTAIIGLNGSFKTSSGEIRVSNVCLEEEAAQILEKHEESVIYGLDRLGISLIEIGTFPDIKSPEEVKEAAKKIEMMLRSTGKVQRGIGTIRQDVNVSIEGGARVEIKGLQELRTMDKIVEGEVERQEKLLEIREVLKKRKALPAGTIDVTSVFLNTKNKMISDLIKKNKKVFAFKLSGFSGLMKKNICFGKTFAKELVDYAKAHGVNGFIHSNEDLGSYNLTREFMRLKDSFKAKENDVIGIIIEESEKAKKACSAVVERAKIALGGVPEETRCANPDMTTSYLRPLPGGARMYPETDIKPISVTKELLDVKMPESFEEKKKKFVKAGLSEEQADQMIKSQYLNLFEDVLEVKTDYKKAANVLLSEIKDLRRQGVDTDKIKDKELKEMLFSIDKVPKESYKEFLSKMSDGTTFKEINNSFSTIDVSKLDKIIDKHLDDELIKKEGLNSFKKIMGPVMGDVRGKIDGETVAKRLRQKIQEKVK